MPEDATERADLESPKPSLVHGRAMLCPNCEQERDPLDQRQFKRLDRNEKYAHELNVVYQCVKTTGGCGHVFSPGDPNFLKVIQAWLSGDLVASENNVDKTKEVEVVSR